MRLPKYCLSAARSWQDAAFFISRTGITLAAGSQDNEWKTETMVSEKSLGE